MKFELRTNAKYFTDEELIKDLKQVSKSLKKEKITQSDYEEYGNFSKSTFHNRFGSWNKALEAAGLAVSIEQNISDVKLFENLEIVWRIMGRQPKYSEMTKPLSNYSTKPYDSRFGGWMNACKAFIEYKENDIEFVKLLQEKPKKTRYINEKVRLKILKRDNYRCIKCGRSPATHLGISLHIDHIQPFSKGGDSNEENLQTLCNKCNLGKGNDDSV
ncbi:homing endonuclease associated repeat-containing protein [Aliarcobacter butzleri]|uniref:homing endonuclease associated repeat-containing protein n=1 Tax=Aliarcobacter butzleri TaxID=28197 RepID=UPI0012612BB9|nr:HNH endonuclease [Aliarcobacter butzleri]